MTKSPELRRLRPTTPPAPPRASAPEGQRAAWWREHVMGWSRPQLAEHLGVQPPAIARTERLDKVPALYRLACAALMHGKAPWQWMPADPDPWNAELRSHLQAALRLCEGEIND